ncbi:MAG: hypothetical protein HC897_10580 [Thermoanaerobaculia bacterium]|nr:hypothetical protein [Thermoanaerobaculia bacterium]
MRSAQINTQLTPGTTISAGVCDSARIAMPRIVTTTAKKTSSRDKTRALRASKCVRTASGSLRRISSSIDGCSLRNWLTVAAC